MEGSHAPHALFSTVILLIAGILSIAIMRRLRLSPIIGYLLAGMIIGVNGLGLIEKTPATDLLAELGVVFLLFDIGLHFSLAHIWDARKDILGLGPLQVLLCTVVFAIPLWMLGLPPEIAILIAATLALSSTAVATQILADNQQHNCPVAISAVAVLIFQDICAIFLLILANSLETSESPGLVISLAAFKSVIAFAAAILAGRYPIGPLFRWTAKYRDDELFTAVALLIVLATAFATGLLELSLTLGAFLAGMILSETPYRHIIQTEIKPFRGLLLGFFFISVGMSLDTAVLLSQWWKVLLFAISLVIIKTLMIYVAASVLRFADRNATQMGLLLAQGSEFAFVILAIPVISDQLDGQLLSILITGVAISMALTPVMVNIGRNISRRQAEHDWEQAKLQQQKPQQEAHTIIVGMGEVGRRLADALEAFGISYKALEVNHDCFVDACANGYPVGFGDATDLRLMDTIRMSHAHNIAITFADYAIARELAPVVRERHPELDLIVSVKTEQEKQRFDKLGMLAVVQHSFPRGIDFAAQVLAANGVDNKKIYKWMKHQQDYELDMKETTHLTAT